MFTTLLAIATIVAAILGAGVGYLATRPTITRLRAELADAAWKLTHDPLTGLLNRTGLRTIHTAVVTASPPQSLVVMLIDLDRFKEVNDTHGHDAGDDLLVEIADRLTQAVHTYGGTAARLAGDEFTAILPLRHHPVGDIADRIVSAITAPVNVQINGGLATVTVTASVGIATVVSTDALQDIALHRADIAMYHAKRQGPGRHVVYADGMTMPDRAHRRGPRLRDLRRDQRGSAE
ncbi:diguanylate cyclase (GGDEF) domain-containing protein [Micromonospora haikouensis]|uniref:Diguanylate cyclase (GGDEF) domain-containing protein n=1 Tax=Micromonospora haikouensis TaxID=686309 RepID=A0A1C4YTA9_9ACTN|nr:GGDEF domain-containing protein [Micromonospora haikouensis]SCF23900.1 diguanylate cyclase (GGDEF) domain-containing protein [Micromonospora haikouensis]